MKVILLSGLAAFAIAAPAIAADLPIKSGPFVPAPAAPNWSGFYLGGNIGYLVQHDPSSLTDFTQPAAPVSNPALSTASATSFTGGLQAGYNWQFAPQWVVGVEGDWNWLRAGDSLCRATDSGGAAECSDTGRGFLTMSENTNWLASARGRLGWAWNNILFYGTGGAAWGSVQTTLTASCTVGGCGNNGTASFTSISFSDTRTGWVAGLGAEAMLGAHWSARLEWLHYDLGTVTDSFIAPAAVGSYGVSWSRGLEYETIRLGANYKF
jgi:outer membrane immunogenic protein